MSTFGLDLRFALRLLFKTPLLSAAVVLSLALGIGANAAVFSVVDALLVRPLPVDHPDRLVTVFTTVQEVPDLLPNAYPDFRDFVESTESFSSLVAYRLVIADLGGEERPERLRGSIVTGNYFETLGLEAERGRLLRPTDQGPPGREPVVVLGHSLWAQRFGSDPELVGNTVRLNGQPFTVVGIAPDGFAGVELLNGEQFWAPLSMYDPLLPSTVRPWIEDREGLLFDVFGRLAPGAKITEARAELQTVAGRLATQFPDENEGRSVSVLPLAKATIHPGERDDYVFGGSLLLAAAAILFLIACANVGGLLTVRAIRRREEIAVRMAVGIGRAQLMKQLLIEGMILSFIGGAAAIAMVPMGRKLLWIVSPPGIPDTLDVDLGPRVILLVLGLTVLSAVVFGLLPGLQLARENLVTALKGEGSLQLSRSRSILGRVLVTTQVALSTVAMSGALLLVLSLQNAKKIDPRFDTQNLAVISANLGNQGFDEARARRFQERAIEALDSMPAIESATFAKSAPLSPGGWASSSVYPEGRAEEEGMSASINVVGPKYFETLGLARVSGRFFDDTDRENTRPVTVVSRTLAERLWPKGDAVGRQLRFVGYDRPAEVVGVVDDAQLEVLGQDPAPYAFVPMSQRFSPWITFHLRVDGDPDAVLPSALERIQALEPDVPFYDAYGVGGLIDRSLWAPRMGAWLLGFFGLFALLLACVGVYAQVAFSVSQRERDYGIRLAFGAQRGAIFRMVVRQTIVMCLIGAALGIGISVFSAQLLSGYLFGVESYYPVVLLSAVLLMLVAIVASALPARRATAVAPAVAMQAGRRHQTFWR